MSLTSCTDLCGKVAAAPCSVTGDMDIVIACLRSGAHLRHDRVIGVSVKFCAIAIQRTLRESGNQGREPSRAAEDVIAKLEGTDLVDSIASHQDLLKA